MTEELVYRIALTKLPSVGPKISKALLHHFGNASSVFKSSFKERLKVPGVGVSTSKSFQDLKILEEAKKECDYILDNKINVLYYQDDNYPRRLKHFDQSPIILYYKGNAELNPNKTVAIVGTRNPTPSGKILTEKIVRDLSSLGVTIVSGLAFGIDAIAHKTSVIEGIPTVGVLGHGLDRIYPQEHRKLSINMLENGGLLTEFCSGTNPDRQNFPMRNRIIASLADVVIVVESKLKGGSIITAEFANEYNKDVFAIPGKPGDINSQGCNALIKRTKAHLMEDVEDLKYIMRWEDVQEPKSMQSNLFQQLSEKELKVVDLIRMNKEITIDELSYKLSKNSSELASLLLNLEFKGVIRSLPGSRYLII